MALRTPSKPRPAAQSPSTSSTAIRSRAGRSALWTLSGYAGGQGLRLVGNLILTRLLFAEAFGLMALVAVFMTGLALFSDVGIGPSIIQNKRGDDPRFLNTAWTVQTVRGAALWIAACIGAAPFAAFYGEAQLAWIVPISGLAALLGGFNSTKLFTANRHLKTSLNVIVELSSQFAGLVAMVTWALVSPSIWALVSGGLVTSATKMVLSHVLLPGDRNRFCWDKDAARELFAFGRWIFFSTLLTFLVMQSDRLIFGKMIPLSLLGVYSIALMFATLPSIVAGYVGNQIVFPLYSRIHQSGEDLGPVYRRTRWAAMLLGGTILSVLITAGPSLIGTLYDERYHDAGWILQLLAVGAWFGVMDATNTASLLARGKARVLVLANASKLVAMIALIPLGYSIAEFPGAVAGFAASELVRYGVAAIVTNKSGLAGWNQDVALSSLVAAVSVVGVFGARWLESIGTPHVAVGLVCAALVASSFGPPVLRHVKRARADGHSLLGV
jgi:O-antigen/teichoic acid export membrane protein